MQFDKQGPKCKGRAQFMARRLRLSKKKKKKVSRWCSGHESYCSRLYEREPQHGSKGQEQGPFRNHKDKGQCSETADIIQQSNRTELGWAVRIKKKRKKSRVCTQDGLVGPTGAQLVKQ